MSDLLSEKDWIQIEMVAKGCVSGTLVEWPRLRLAFDRLGLDSRGNMVSGKIRDICGEIWEMKQK